VRPDSPPPATILARNSLLGRELVGLVEALGRAGVPVVVLKGPVLARRLGMRPDDRLIVDNDILVRRMDAPRAARVLSELGYQALDQRSLRTDLDNDFQHMMVRAHSSGSALLAELHWRGFSPFHFTLPDDVLWNELVSFDFDGTRVSVLAQELELLHIAAHFTQHRLGEPRVLKTLGRAWSLWHGSSDLGKLRRLASEGQLLHAFDYALHAAWALGHASAPPPWAPTGRARALAGVLPPERLNEIRPDKDYARMLLSFMLVRPGKAALQLARSAFPTPAKMRAIHGPVSPAELVGLYAARPLRPLARSLGWRPQRESRPE